MKKAETLLVKYHQANVGTLSLSVDNKLCAFEYDSQWLADGFSISPLELPLKPGVFLAKPTPFSGNFGILPLHTISLAAQKATMANMPHL